MSCHTIEMYLKLNYKILTFDIILMKFWSKLFSISTNHFFQVSIYHFDLKFSELIHY